jgi:hypothetical protein
MTFHGWRKHASKSKKKSFLPANDTYIFFVSERSFEDINFLHVLISRSRMCGSYHCYNFPVATFPKETCFAFIIMTHVKDYLDFLDTMQCTIRQGPKGLPQSFQHKTVSTVIFITKTKSVSSRFTKKTRFKLALFVRKEK